MFKTVKGLNLEVKKYKTQPFRMFKVACFFHSVNLKMYDICHISAACRVEYEIKNEQS